MARDKRRGETERRPIWLLLLTTTVVIVAIALFSLRSTPTKLDEQDYKIAMALYRVCNQQSEKGLQTVKELIDASASQTDQSSPGKEAIREIIALADGGQWEPAMKACRVLLDDQAKR